MGFGSNEGFDEMKVVIFFLDLFFALMILSICIRMDKNAHANAVFLDQYKAELNETRAELDRIHHGLFHYWLSVCNRRIDGSLSPEHDTEFCKRGPP